MSAELPDLKKKEKERKKAGAFWGNGAAGRAAFQGAEGGLGAGGELAAGELAAGEAAAGMAGESASGLMAAFRSMGLRGLLAELSATLGGKLVIAGALLALIGGAVAAAVALGILPLGAGGAARGEGALDLSAPDGSPRMRFPKRSRSIDYLRQAYQGELKGDEAAQNGEKKDGDGKAEGGKDTAGTDGKDAGKGSGWRDVLSNFADWRKDKLAHNLSMAKLSDSLGGGFSKNIFAASNAPKFGDGFDRGKLAQAVPAKPSAASAGKSQSMRDKRASTGKATGQSAGIHAKRAIGQLRAAQTLSSQASGAGNEEVAKTMAGDAFNGGVTQGGVAPFSPIGMDNPTAGGAGTPPNPGGVGGTPPSVLLPEAPDATPIPQGDYQPKVDMAKDLIDKAAAMKKKSMMLIAAGIALMAAGAALLSNPFTAAIGAAMIAAGALLLGMGIMLMIMAGKLAAQAKQIGQQLEQAFGQEAQKNVIDTCATQAAASGTKCAQSVTDKQAPALPANNQMGDAGKAAQDENHGPDSGYTVDGGGKPIDSGGGH